MTETFQSQTITVSEYEEMPLSQKLWRTFVRESDGKAWTETINGPFAVNLVHPQAGLILILDKTFTIEQLTGEHGLTLIQAIEYQWRLEQERRMNQSSWKTMR